MWQNSRSKRRHFTSLAPFCAQHGVIARSRHHSALARKHLRSVTLSNGTHGENNSAATASGNAPPRAARISASKAPRSRCGRCMRSKYQRRGSREKRKSAAGGVSGGGENIKAAKTRRSETKGEK